MISSPLFASSQFKLSKMANFLLLIFCFFPIFLPKLAAVEQTLIIDFEKGPSHSARPRSGDYPPDGFGNLLTIEKGNRVRQSRGDKLPNSLQELNELILNMDKAYARRFEQLSKRLDRLEANQLNFRHAALAEWSAFSVDKRIRLFSHMKNGWGEAEQICRAHSGQLLQIESADENRRISEYLKGIDGIYWIGMQRTLQFNISSNYSNFDDGELGKRENLLDDPMRRCAAIQAREAEDGGRWLSRECGEKLAFICQI